MLFSVTSINLYDRLSHKISKKLSLLKVDSAHRWNVAHVKPWFYVCIEGEDTLPETDEESPEKMYNAVVDLWSRFEAEKKHLLQNLKGIMATKRDGVKVNGTIMWYLKKKVPSWNFLQDFRYLWTVKYKFKFVWLYWSNHFKYICKI